MWRSAKGLVLIAAILALGFLAAGCGQDGGGGAFATLSPTKSAFATFSPTKSVGSPTKSIGLPSRSPTPEPSTSVPTTDTTQPSPTPSTASSSPASRPSSSPAHGTGSSSSLLWLWIALGVVILIAVIVLITRSAGRRSAATASWRSKVTDAYAQGSALYDAMRLAETAQARAAGDASTRWPEIERRADDLTQTLHALREGAPDEDSLARVSEVLGSLQALRFAVDAERASGGTGEPQRQVVRSRLADFEMSLRDLRPPDHRLA